MKKLIHWLIILVADFLFCLGFYLLDVSLEKLQVMFVVTLIVMYVFSHWLSLIAKSFQVPDWSQLKSKLWWKIPLVAACFAIWFYNAGTLLDAVILTFGLLSFITLFEARFSFLIALICMSYMPMLLYFPWPKTGELLLSYTFYFLVIGLVTFMRYNFLQTEND